MDAESTKEVDEVALASVAAEALGKDSGDIADAFKELDMEHYDEEDDDGIDVFSKGLGDAYYPSSELDPYLKDKDDNDSEEEEDMIIRAEDSIIVCARNEEEISQLEVYILEDTEDGPNLYVHHDIIISAFPLCTAWLDCPLKGGERGNFIAVGSMEPSIEIWDLDIIDEVEPSLVLGGVDECLEKKKKRKKPEINPRWFPAADILAAGTGEATQVQAVAFSHHVPQILLSGSFDHSIVMKDGRKPSHSGYRWFVVADVESLAWDPHTEHSFVVSLENGMIQGFDIRAASSSSDSELKPSFTIHAHDKAASSISYNPSIPNLLASGSIDKMVKLWDLTNNQPSCISSRNPKAGAVFSVSFSQENPLWLAIGGSKGILDVWDTSSEAGVAKKYSKNIDKKS
uniref:Transducin/WD40 repeat-like superfamily protein n=1 Tax=Chenopodium quinoa TaxID=63459 RepID=A0A803N207_CHEQI